MDRHLHKMHLSGNLNDLQTAWNCSCKLQTVQCRWYFKRWSHVSDCTTQKCLSKLLLLAGDGASWTRNIYTTHKKYLTRQKLSSALWTVAPQEVDARHDLTFRKLHLLLNGLLFLQIQQEESFPFTSMFGFLSADSPSTHSELEKHTMTINTVPARPKKI